MASYCMLKTKDWEIKKIKKKKKTVFKNNELSSNCNWGKIDKNKRLKKKRTIIK